MLVNVSNHPSNTWQKKQRDAASVYGDIVDLPFPPIPASASETDIRQLVEEYLSKITALHPEAVFTAGEYIFVYMLVDALSEYGIPVLCSATDRIAEEKRMEDGSINKTIRFDFVRFRQYQPYRKRLPVEQ